MKLKKWLLALLVSLLMMPVHAVQAEDNTAAGTLTLQLTDQGDREGVRFQLEKAADIRDGNYVLTSPFEDARVDLNGLKTAAEMEQAALELAELSESHSSEVEPVEIRTDSEGTAWAELDMGVWLVRQTDGAGYGWIAPFLCAVPSWDTEGNDMTWDTVVQPKREAFPKLVIEKVDEAGNPVTGQDFSFVLERDGQQVPGAADQATGTVTFDLRWGKVDVTEAAAPAGYEKSSRVVKIELGQDVKVDGTPVVPQDGLIRVQYKNRKQPSVPEKTPTGLESGKSLWAAAGLIALAGLGIAFTLLRRER